MSDKPTCERLIDAFPRKEWATIVYKKCGKPATQKDAGFHHVCDEHANA